MHIFILHYKPDETTGKRKVQMHICGCIYLSHKLWKIAVRYPTVTAWVR